MIINNNTGLKCWPCRGRTPSYHYQAFLTDYADTTTFAWILDVWQLKNGSNKYFRHEYYRQSSQNLCNHIFNCWLTKGQFRTHGHLLVYIWVITQLVYTLDFATCTPSGVSIALMKILREIKKNGKICCRVIQLNQFIKQANMHCSDEPNCYFFLPLTVQDMPFKAKLIWLI